jgi:hypothetical protein
LYPQRTTQYPKNQSIQISEKPKEPRPQKDRKIQTSERPGSIRKTKSSDLENQKYPEPSVHKDPIKKNRTSILAFVKSDLSSDYRTVKKIFKPLSQSGFLFADDFFRDGCPVNRAATTNGQVNFPLSSCLPKASIRHAQ